jgi:rsbT co-antagonist protein RsbR
MPDVLTRDSLLTFFQYLPFAACIVELQGDAKMSIVAVNDASERIFGASAPAVGSALDERIPALRGTGVVEMCVRVATSGEASSIEEVKIETGAGGARVMGVKAFAMGERRAALVFEDKTASKEAEQKTVRRLRDAYTTMLNSVPDIVFVKSAEDDRYLIWNQACVDSTGIPAERALGARLEDLFPPETAAVLDATDKKVLAGTEALSFEEVLPGPKGPRMYLTIKRPIHDENGRAMFMLGASKDITDRKNAEEALKKTSEELHETRTNLMETIRELSTPVLPIHDGVLVVPLVGHMDSQRSGQLTEALLASIQRHRADTVIIDITGLEMIDTAVASHLIQTTRAASLLGTECVLVGIAPPIARTLVQIGVDFGTLTTRRDLQAGVAYALEQKTSDEDDE